MKQSQFNFFGKTAVIVCHDSVPGPPHNLRDYLLEHGITRLLVIGHVNRFVIDNPIKHSYIQIYEKGLLIRSVNGKVFQLPEAIMYIHDAALTFYWTLKYSKGRVDFFIGLGNLNAWVGIMLQRINKIRNTIYYVIDYMPQRFPNPFLNNFYHTLDKICAEQANSTWNYGKGMMIAREKRWKKRFFNQLHTPHGVTLRKEIISNMERYDSNNILYMGSLLEQQGLQLIIKALPSIIKTFPKLKLTIIGIGPYRKELEKEIIKNHLSHHVEFLGFVEDPKYVDLLLSQGSIGLATYKNDMGFVMYTEPSKVKRYLSCCLPVLITEGTPLSEDILENDCGMVCTFQPEDAAKKIISMLRNKQHLSEMRKNSLIYAKRYTWDTIYERAFNLTV